MIVKFLAPGSHAFHETYLDAGSHEVNCYSIGIEAGDQIGVEVGKLLGEQPIWRYPCGDLEPPLRIVVVTVEGQPGIWVGRGGDVYLMNGEGKTIDRP
jgi:hypothetical protein